MTTEPTVAALERIAVVLEQIGDVLVAIQQALLATTPPPVADCAHPLAARIDTGSTMGRERWRCKLCGYEVTS